MKDKNQALFEKRCITEKSVSWPVDWKANVRGTQLQAGTHRVMSVWWWWGGGGEDVDTDDDKPMLNSDKWLGRPEGASLAFLRECEPTKLDTFLKLSFI